MRTLGVAILGLFLGLGVGVGVFNELIGRLVVAIAGAVLAVAIDKRRQR